MLVLIVNTATAWAGGDPTGAKLPKEGVDKLTHGEIGLNLLWIVIGAVLVIFMQAGFALVETGFCRAKHAAHVVSTNFAIFGLGFVAFFVVGYAFAFGGFSASAINLAPAGGAHANLIGSGNWIFLWKGGVFLQGHGYDVSA